MIVKKFFYVLTATAMLVACKPTEPKDPNEKDKVAFAQATYFEALGTNTVPNVEGENKDQPFSMYGVRVEVVILSDNTLDINLYGINFSSRMPITIDMVIPAVNYTRTADKVTIGGEGIIPTMGGNPFDRYVINALSGTITADSLCFSNSYGQYDGCTYAGKIIKMEER